MNARDKELAKQAWTENDWEGHVDIPKLIQLVRADAMEVATRAANESWTLVCKKMVELEREAIFNIVQKIAARFYKDATEEAFDELTDAILLRGNT